MADTCIVKVTDMSGNEFDYSNLPSHPIEVKFILEYDDTTYMFDKWTDENGNEVVMDFAPESQPGHEVFVYTVDCGETFIANIKPIGQPLQSNYLTFTANNNGTTFGINFDGIEMSRCPEVLYSTDGGLNWNSISNNGQLYTLPETFNAGDKVMWKGGTRTTCYGIANYGVFKSSDTFDVSGDLMSLKDGYETGYTGMNPYDFYGLFEGSKVSDASQLNFPSAIANYCYQSMFRGCTDLKYAPSVLPATTLSAGCYFYMFEGCASLTTVPNILAQTMAARCCVNMFQGCATLTTVPSTMLSDATTLATDCCSGMFANCIALTTVPDLPATTLAVNCYISMFAGCSSLRTIPQTMLPSEQNLAAGCYGSMFYDCSSLISVPSDLLPATTLEEGCYGHMFFGCRSLYRAPKLPATTLAVNCYISMFAGCTSLNYINAQFTTTPSTTYTQDWVKNVAPTGTFVKNFAATWTSFEADYAIPFGWLPNYLTFTAKNSGTTFGIDFNNISTDDCRDIQYSTDGGTYWETIQNDGQSHTLPHTFNAGDTVKWRGPNNIRYGGQSTLTIGVQFTSSDTFDVSGDIGYLLSGYEEYRTVDVTDWCFAKLFSGSNVVDASGLLITRDTDRSCYYQMFAYCTDLTGLPQILGSTYSFSHCEMFKGCTALTEIPSDFSLSAYMREMCFSCMFMDCTALTTVPSTLLPSTRLASDCYNGMFANCTALTTVPDLPATTLAYSCYSGMFFGCSALTTIPPTMFPSTQILAQYCYQAMFRNCTALMSVPGDLLPATTLANSCYYSMFDGCSSLQVAPDLPATTLVQDCYTQMFKNCSQLNYINAQFTTTPSTTYTRDWVQNVAPTGTFVKSVFATWPDSMADYAIPNGWIVRRYIPSTVGTFTINNNNDTVRFAPGNLRYNADLDMWSLAENQWDAIGRDNENVAPDYPGWIDIFGYGCNNEYNGQQEYKAFSTGVDGSEYYQYNLDSQSDWGLVMNQATGETGWRTLTPSEWYYIIWNRPGYTFAKCIINAQQNCLILFPDRYTPEGITSPGDQIVPFSSNPIDSATAQRLINDGCVFLPCGGRRSGTSVQYLDNGRYWTSSISGAFSSGFIFNDSYISPGGNMNKSDGCSVRLVRNDGH